MGEYFGQSHTPPLQNLGSEMGSIEGQAGGLLSAEEKFGNYQVNTLYPQMESQEISAANSQARNQNQMMGKLGPRYQATLGAVSPLFASGQTAIAGQLATAGQPTALQSQITSAAQNAGPSALSQQLQSSASQQLTLGAGLSPDQAREVTQATDAGMNSRGIVGSNPAMFAEALNRDQYGQQLLQQREGFAQGVNQQGLQEQQMNRQFQTGVSGQQMAQQGQTQQFDLSAQQAGQNALAPALGLMGQQASVQPSQAATVLGASSSAFDPMMSYGSNLNDWNYNAQAATILNNANNMAAIHGAIIGAVGSMAGGAMSACWVAREVLGEYNLEWAAFRAWLTEDAPVWFYTLYFRHGERVARWLRKRPLARRVLEPVMGGIARRKLARSTQPEINAMLDLVKAWLKHQKASVKETKNHAL